MHTRQLARERGSSSHWGGLQQEQGRRQSAPAASAQGPQARFFYSLSCYGIPQLVLQAKISSPRPFPASMLTLRRQ